VQPVRATIQGLGVCIPTRILTNDDLARMVDTTDEWITARTGIKRRHLAEPDQATSDLALIAAQRALAQARVAPGVAAPLLGGERDFTDELGERGAPLLVGDRLLPLDLLPLTVTSHRLLEVTT